MSVPILKIRGILIASIQTELTDTEWEQLRDRLLSKASETRARSAVIDVTGMPLLDSFAGRTLNGISEMLRLRGVTTVVAGIQPWVAMSMAQLGLKFERTRTVLDLEEAVELLDNGERTE